MAGNACDPVSGVPDAGRYSETNITERGDAGTYRWRAATIEEENQHGGWLPNETPTGDNGNLIDLFTIGSRGDPDLDNDPVPDPAGGYKQGH